MSTVNNFADKKFKIECSQITLTNSVDSDISGRGPGEIWQDEDGTIQFRIHLIHGYKELCDFQRNRDLVPGQVYPDNCYFNLEVQEYSGPSWVAQRVLPNYRGGLARSEGIAHGGIPELSRSENISSSSDSSYVVLRINGMLDFPCNQVKGTKTEVAGEEWESSSSRDVAIFGDDSYEFKLFPEGEHTIVSLKIASDCLKQTTHSRMAEALQFVLGRRIDPLVIETHSDGKFVTRLLSQSFKRSGGTLLPPLLLERHPHEEDIRKLFLCYFMHIHDDGESDKHPISIHIGSVTGAAAAFLETDILALSVATEGLAGSCFANLAEVDQSFLKELASVQETLKKNHGDSPTFDRISGAIRAMQAPRSSDCLRAFIKANALDKRLFDSWRNLRHPSAHGGGLAGREMAAVLKLRDEVLSLLYAIVLETIGYSGQRTDYSTHGWPTVPWPVQAISE